MAQAKTYLYRIENPNILATPNGITSHEILIGQWFSPNPATVVNYLRKSQRLPGARLVVASVTTDSLEGYHAKSHPLATQMDIEDDNYMIPLDGTVPLTSLPLDEVVGDLNAANVRQRLEALSRIESHLAQMSLLNTPHSANTL